jgi:dTMP kinase
VKKGLFITFEGGDGSGKTTQSLLLYKYLKKRKCNAIFTREPGGTKIAESIRKVLLDPRNKISPMTELLLYEASRAQHASELISPALEAGKIVICDRFTDATIAYQGFARGLGVALTETLNAIATGGISPDLTIYLDVPAGAGLKRARSLKKFNKRSADRLENENLAFHEKVREGYLKLAKQYPKRIKMLAPSGSIEDTQEKIIDIVNKRI